MKLKLLTLLIISGLLINVGCSSSNDGETDAAESTDPALDTEGAQAAEDMDEISEEDDIAADEEVVAEEDGLPEESLEEGSDGEETADAEGSDEEEVVEEGSETADGSLSADGSSEEVVTADTGTDAPTSSEATDESVFSADSASTPSDSSTEGSSLIDEAPKPVASLKKIKDVPFTEAGLLLNTVYVARDGDSWKGVAAKIYGDEGKSKELKKSNPYLSYRDLKVGDKVYYNSPKRSQDADRMLTYYEDNGLPAQTYVAKAGENIRTISQQLLGNPNSWKEVWSTNLAVESKAELPEGTELRYWVDTGAVAQAPADVAAPVEQQIAEPQAPAVAQNGGVQDDFALPDEMNADGQAAGTVADVSEPPPPPPPPAPKAEKSVASNDLMGNKDMAFILAAGGLLLAGIGIILSIVKKNKARKMNMSTHTQI